MRRINLFYFIREAVQNIFLHGFMSFAAVGILAACLLITGSFSLIALNIDSIIADIESQSEITVFVDEDYPEERAVNIKGQILQIPNVKSAEFISKEQALAEYKASLGENGELLEGLEDDNPLRDSYRIRMEDLSVYKEVSLALQNISGIARVESRRDTAERLIQIRGVVNAVSVALILMLGAVSVFIVSNTVRMATFTRREEIAIMKMVGAANSFVRWPFVIEGVLLGEMGAFTAYFMLWGFYTYLQDRLMIGLAFISLLPFSTMSHMMMLLLAGVGLIIGAGGSVLAIRRFLNV